MQWEVRVMLSGWILPELRVVVGNKAGEEAEVDLHVGCAPFFSTRSPAKVWASWP